MATMNSTAAVLARLKQSFISELSEKIDDIEEDLLACTEGHDFSEVFQEAYRKTHSLKGTGGTFGVLIITSICHQLEDTLTLWESEQFANVAQRQARCLDYIDLLRRVSDTLSDGGSDFDQVAEYLRQLQGDGDKLRVMLVDNSRTTREICKQAIAEYNVEIVEMQDGYEALGRLLHEHFDVLIAGKEVGLLDGQMLISIVSQLRGAASKVHTIMITSSKQDFSGKKRCSDPAQVVSKGAKMVSELQAGFQQLKA